MSVINITLNVNLPNAGVVFTGYIIILFAHELKKWLLTFKRGTGRGLHRNEWRKPRSHGLTYVNMFFGYTLIRCSAHKPQANKTQDVNYTWIIHIQLKNSKSLAFRSQMPKCWIWWNCLNSETKMFECTQSVFYWSDRKRSHVSTTKYHPASMPWI